MKAKIKKPLTLAGAMVALMVPVLIIAGLFVHELVGRSLGSLEKIDGAMSIADTTLRAQLDEETGVRGYAATGNPMFLEPYVAARARIDEDFVNLRTQLRQIGAEESDRAATDAERFNKIWINDLVTPVLHSGHPLGSHFTLQAQYHGKLIIDRIRADFDGIMSGLTARREHIMADARTSVDRIVLFVLVATSTLLALGYLFLVEQRRLNTRIEREREHRVEDQRRVAELRMMVETEKRIADTLQEALLQRPLPSLPAVRFSATYVPATEEAKVGGDWYDAIELSRERVLFTIGDVAGHGLDAAVGMSRARQAFVGSALLDADPARMLSRVNDELVAENSAMVTAVCGVADSSRFEFIFATAGHPPPVLIEPGRPPRLLECGGLPLGILGQAEYKTFVVQTVPGAMLVLYTDGAVEHSHDVLTGETILLEAAAKCEEQPETDPATVIHRSIFEGRAAGDDVAILTIGFASQITEGLKISAEYAQSSFSGRIRKDVTPTAPRSLARFPREKAA